MAIAATFPNPARLSTGFEALTKTASGRDFGSTQSRLDSWKEIATYLKRSVRAVGRWERLEGLPVHRHHHGKQATVYALAQEIDQWLQSRSGQEQARQLVLDRQAVRPATPCVDVAGNGPPIIAVLPLRSPSDGPEGEWFADGLTDEVISAIGRCCPHELRVIALTSAMQFKESSKTIEQIGKELNADFILEGSIQRYGDRVRLNVRVIATRDQAHVAAETFEIQLPPILSLQQSLAQQVADSVSSQFNVATEKDRTRSLSAPGR